MLDGNAMNPGCYNVYGGECWTKRNGKYN